MAAVDAVLSPPVRLPSHSVGFLLTLKEQNAWWKTNVALEAIALIRGAWADLYGDAVAPGLTPHAMEHAPGALFIALDVPTGAKCEPVAIAHRILEKVKDEQSAKALGVHLMRVLPVEDSCSITEVKQIEEMAKKLASKHLPEGAAPTRFAVRPELHSPNLGAGTNAGDLVRRVAEGVPRVHTVDLDMPTVVILLMLVGDIAMMSIVHDWHELHKFNVQTERKQEAAAGAVAGSAV